MYFKKKDVCFFFVFFHGKFDEITKCKMGTAIKSLNDYEN